VSSLVIRAIPGFCQPISSLSHLAAAAVGVVAAFPLLRSAGGNRGRVAAVGIYVSCVIATLGISGAYHSIDRGSPARDLMMHIDHYAIWLLIAGTFTAVHGIMFQGFWRTGVLAFAWIYAAVGVSLQIYRFDIFGGWVGLLLYLGLGWFGIVSIVKAGREVGFPAVRLIWLAGLAYSTGAVLEATVHWHIIDHWVGPHELFHVAVIVGVTMHWVFIRRMVRRYAAASRGMVASPTPVEVAGLPVVVAKLA
jgi:channel protein (hemolysin III family)